MTQRDVRSMLADRSLIALRRGGGGALAIPALAFVDGEGAARVLPSLRGTLITLADAGYDDEEAWSWLTGDVPELGGRPIDALSSGRVHAVRTVACTLAF